jgi:NAD(P)-dependent dehydrogenase (short-subunit alcohol dehydrogenase family)
MPVLAGRVALVTGAGRGLGRACALALAAEGAELHLVARSRDDLETLAGEIRGRGGAARTTPCDITDAAAVRAVFADIDTLDVLVNNAGGNFPEPFVEVSEAHLDHLLDLNVRAQFVVAQAAVRCMLALPDRKARGASIVNMSSQMGHVGAPGRTVYCMTKHAIEGLTKAMAVELAPQGIRVNTVAPTFVETPMTAHMFARPEFGKWVLDRIPMGRVGTPEEVAAAVVWLASPAAALVTGTSLKVDGGWTAQ